MNKKILIYKNERLSLIIVIITMLALLYLFYEINIYLMLGVIVFSLFYILLIQSQQRGNSLKVTKDQYPNLFKHLISCANTLGVKRLPDLYIHQDPYLNAFAMGFKHPYIIVLNSAVVENLESNEIKSIIGHEMGHLRFKHTQILSIISPAGKKIPFVDYIFGFWSRRAEYTADRSALLCVGDKKTVIKTLLKIAYGPKVGKKVNFDELMIQLEKSISGKLDYLGETLGNHPYITKRIWEIIKFDSVYNLNSCENCETINNKESSYCWACGTKLKK